VQTSAMEEDAQALEALFAHILKLHPPGPGRNLQLTSLRRMAIYTRCPHWPLGREWFVLQICRQSEIYRQLS
jgi:hypothetical protein